MPPAAPITVPATTVMVALAALPSLVAVTVAVPTAIAVTNPVAVTVAMPEADVVQVIARPASVFPTESFGVAVNCNVPVVPSVPAAGESVTEATGTAVGVTVTVALAD